MDKVRPGDPFVIEADEWNAWADSIEAIAGITAAPPLSLSGRVLSDATPRPSWFRLSGTASPYDARQVVRRGGAWADAAYSCTACLVEANAVAGLAGKVVRAWPGSPGEHVFQHVRRGATTCTGAICVTVTTPGVYTPTPVPGATVTVYDGPTVGSPVLGTCTTDPAGRCCVDIHEAKTYAVKVEMGSCSATTTVAAGCYENDVSFTYCNPTLTIHVADSYTGDPVAGATVTFTGSTPPLTDGTTDAGGDYAASYCFLGTNPAPTGSTSIVVAKGGTQLDICRPVQPLDCTSRTVNLLMVDTGNYLASTCCTDAGCSDGTAGTRGLIARTLHVRFAGAHNPSFPVVTAFGTDEGAWIPVVWDGVVNADHSVRYASACRPGNGQTSHDNGCAFTTPYGSTRVTLQLCVSGSGTTAGATVTYSRYSSTDCTVPGTSFSPCGCSRSGSPLAWFDFCQTQGSHSGPKSEQCSPTNMTFPLVIGGSTAAVVDIIE